MQKFKKLTTKINSYLKEKGIGTAIHYPVALPFMDAYADLKHTEADFPKAAQFQHEILSLPMYPELTKEMMDYIAETIRNFYNK